MTVMVDLGREYLESGQAGASVALRLECSQEALTACLFTGLVTLDEVAQADDAQLRTMAMSELLMQGAHAMHATGLRLAAEHEDGVMSMSEAVFWLVCWRRVGHAFFGRPGSLWATADRPSAGPLLAASAGVAGR